MPKGIMDISYTAKPKLNAGDGKDIPRLIKELESMHGVAITLQDEKGRMVPVRVNSSTLKLEVFRNNKWATPATEATATTDTPVVDTSNTLRVSKAGQSPYNIGDSDRVVVCDFAGAGVVNLPRARGRGRVIYIKNIGSATATISAQSTETIEGAATKALSQWDTIRVIDYKQGEWLII